MWDLSAKTRSRWWAGAPHLGGIRLHKLIHILLLLFSQLGVFLYLTRVDMSKDLILGMLSLRACEPSGTERSGTFLSSNA